MNGRGPDNVVRFPRDEPAVEPFRPFYISQMQGVEPKPREWLVDGVLLRRTVMLFAGPPKIGKSLLLQQLLTAIALGDHWIDRPTVRCKTFGYYCEDPEDELQRRQTNINAHYNRDPADFEADASWLSRDGKEAVLVDFEKWTEKPKWTDLWYQLVSYVKEEGIQVIGIDTAATVFAGNENARSMTTRFLRELQKLAIEIDGSIILNAHPSRSNPNSFSGTNAWMASVRSGISLGHPPEFDPETREPRNIRMLRGLGSNYGAGIGAERLEYRDGVFVAVDPEPERRRGPMSHQQFEELRFRLLLGLKRQRQNGAEVPADTEHQRGMVYRARRSTDPVLKFASMNDLVRAQEAMIELGQIVRVEVNRKCLLRPADGFLYPKEEPWLPATAPKQKPREAADD